MTSEKCSMPSEGSCENKYDLDSKEVSFSRRAFFGGIIGLGATLWALLVGGTPILSFLWPKKSEAVAISELVLDFKLADFPEGASKNFIFGSIPALLIHGKGGKLTVFNAKCTHLGCTVGYQEDKNLIYCACHGGTYDPNTGKNVGGPPPAPLTPLVAEVAADGTITVKKA
jgi:nitrite reductase/ring-hydroxylating ferredoxin subunit